MGALTHLQAWENGRGELGSNVAQGGRLAGCFRCRGLDPKAEVLDARSLGPEAWLSV